MYATTILCSLSKQRYRQWNTTFISIDFGRYKDWLPSKNYSPREKEYSWVNNSPHFSQAMSNVIHYFTLLEIIKDYI